MKLLSAIILISLASDPQVSAGTIYTLHTKVYPRVVGTRFVASAFDQEVKIAFAYDLPKVDSSRYIVRKARVTGSPVTYSSSWVLTFGYLWFIQDGIVVKYGQQGAGEQGVGLFNEYHTDQTGSHPATNPDGSSTFGSGHGTTVLMNDFELPSPEIIGSSGGAEIYVNTSAQGAIYKNVVQEVDPRINGAVCAFSFPGIIELTLDLETIGSQLSPFLLSHYGDSNAPLKYQHPLIGDPSYVFPPFLYSYPQHDPPPGFNRDLKADWSISPSKQFQASLYGFPGYRYTLFRGTTLGSGSPVMSATGNGSVLDLSDMNANPPPRAFFWISEEPENN